MGGLRARGRLRAATAALDNAGHLRQSSQLATRKRKARAPMQDLDLIDRKIVAELMRDATLPIAMIAERVGLSQTPCWKRIQKLEAMGVLTGRVALADPVKLGFGIQVFVEIEALN